MKETVPQDHKRHVQLEPYRSPIGDKTENARRSDKMAVLSIDCFPMYGYKLFLRNPYGLIRKSWSDPTKTEPKYVW